MVIKLKPSAYPTVGYGYRDPSGAWIQTEPTGQIALSDLPTEAAGYTAQVQQIMAEARVSAAVEEIKDETVEGDLAMNGIGGLSPYAQMVLQTGMSAQQRAAAAADPEILQASLGALIPGAIGLAGRVAPWLARIGLVGGAGYGAYELAGFGQQGQLPGMGGIPIVGPGAPEPAAQYIAKEWSTGTARFYMLIDGSICCRKKNGVWKRWKPARHIVIPRDPKIGTLLRAHKKVNTLVNRLAKRVPSRRTVRRGGYFGDVLSPVERRAVARG